MPRRKGAHKELQDLLDASTTRANIPPPVETRLQVLPFHELTWENFERLSARLISTEGAIYDLYRYGKQGEDQSGIDLIARRWREGQLERWGYQCKRYKTFTASDVDEAVKTFKFDTDHLVILISALANTAIRNAVAKYPHVQLWDAEDISRRLKEHPSSVEDFFDVQWRKAFCGPSLSMPADSSEDAIKRLIGLNLDHHEWIHSNLLPVTKMPSNIYGASLPLTPPTVLTSSEVALVPPLKEVLTKAWSLGALKSPKIARFVGCDPKTVETKSIPQWLLWPKQRNWLIELLNKHLQLKCATLGLEYDKDHRRFYFTPDNGRQRIVTYKAFSRQATRKLAYPYHDKETNELRFWVHQAARLSFVELDKDFYLRVEPAYAFTKDGYSFLASEDIGPLATRRKSGERNQNVFNHLIFWREMLRGPGDDIRIDFGDQSMIISKMYESGKADFGIPSDSALLQEIAMEEDELDLETLIQERQDEDSE